MKTSSRRYGRDQAEDEGGGDGEGEGEGEDCFPKRQPAERAALATLASAAGEGRRTLFRLRKRAARSPPLKVDAESIS